MTKPLPMPSFNPHPKAKGSYRRAIDDIHRALHILNAPRLTPVSSFVFYYLACEKLARIIYGVEKRKGYPEIFKQGSKTPGAGEINESAAKLRLGVRKSDIKKVFSNTGDSARRLRGNLIHEIGPTNARKVADVAPVLVPIMREILKSGDAVIRHIEKLAAAP